MSRPHVRPRFEVHVAADPAHVIERFRSAIRENDGVKGAAFDDRIELTVPNSEQHLYSPALTVRIVEQDGGSMLHARYGPHPHVWTMYMAIYAVVTMATIGAAMYGISQWMVNTTPWALWLAPLGIPLAGLVHGIAYVGQGLGQEQMFFLRTFLTETAGRAGRVTDPPEAPND